MVSTVAFIPARGGSKGIKNKNIIPINQKPLIYWSLLACENCPEIEKTFVSTDSEDIKNVVEKFGFKKVQIIQRSPETASDKATSESALIEFCNNFEFDKVVFLQATSPLTTSNDLSGALKKIEEEKTNSLISVVNNYQFLWDKNKEPINYDLKNRPRRQDWDGYFVENGAFYISSRENILKSKCRISGKISFWQMPVKTLFEIDNIDDIFITELLLIQQESLK